MTCGSFVLNPGRQNQLCMGGIGLYGGPVGIHASIGRLPHIQFCWVISAGRHSSSFVVIARKGIHAEVVRDAKLHPLVTGQHACAASSQFCERRSG